MSLRGMLERETDDIDAPLRADRDGDLLGALRRGEARAAELLVTQYSERAHRLASRITGNGEDAEEVVQDAFWAVVRKIDSFRGDSAFRSWLYRIVANAAYEKLRRRQRRRQDLSLDEVLPLIDESGHQVAQVADWSANADNPALQAELRTVLAASIDELPAACRDALLLSDVEGRSNREIAHALGLSVPVVKTRVHRARLVLRKRLGAWRMWSLAPVEGRDRRGASRVRTTGSSDACGTSRRTSRARPDQDVMASLIGDGSRADGRCLAASSELGASVFEMERQNDHHVQQRDDSAEDDHGLGPLDLLARLPTQLQEQAG